MNLTNEQLAKATAAKSAEEILALARENGIKLTEEEAAKYFAALHKEGEIADEELDNVSGGCGDDGPRPIYSDNTRIRVWLQDGYCYPGTVESSHYVDYPFGCYYYWVVFDNGQRLDLPLESSEYRSEPM